MSETTISKIVVKMGDVEVSLTLNEVKELQKILNDAFPVQPTQTIVYRDWYRPYYWGTSISDNTLYINSSSY